MVTKKTKGHVSGVNGRRNVGKKAPQLQRKSLEVDHWAFLEEIEAPMWADLILEVKSNDEKDDSWFHINHPFHQRSSRQLMSAFSDSTEKITNSSFELQGPSSPKLPQSVSKSRGKDYKTMKWEGNENPYKISRGKISWADSVSSGETVYNPSHGQPIETMGPTKRWVSESSLPETSIITNENGDAPKTTKSSFGLQGLSSPKLSHSVSKSRGKEHKLSRGKISWADSVSSGEMVGPKKSWVSETSVIAQENGQKLGLRKSELVASLKIGVRKSCGMRQPLRVEIKDKDDGQPKGRMSCSSNKSSVGSSYNPGSDFKNMMLRLKGLSDDRNFMKPSQSSKTTISNTMKSSSSTHVQKMASSSRSGGRVVVAKPNNQEIAKSKVGRSKALAPHNVNQNRPVAVATKAKENVEGGKLKKLIGGGKENTVGKAEVSGQSSNANGGLVRGQKPMKPSVPQFSGTARLTAPKVKVSARNEGKRQANSGPRAFR